MELFSQSTGERCKPAQFLAELVCLREGRKKGKSTPPNFWNLPEWKKTYSRQVSLANGLLKLFNFESILLALNDRAGNWIFSLSFPGLIDIIKAKEVSLAKEEVRAQEPQPVYDTVIKTEISQVTTGQYMRKKLEELE